MSDPEDPPRLAHLHAEAFATPWDAGAFRALLDQPGVIARIDADGFILLRVVVDEAEILTLAVRPDARRRGVGRSLVARAVSAGAEAGARRVFLEVADDNAAARALYARSGFRQVGVRPRYYARPDGSRRDALLLSLNLDAPLP